MRRPGSELIPAPIATYRVQLGPDFDLHAAAGLTDYLAELGVSHLYCSPFLRAAPEAGHGYAVVDYQQVDERLGGEEGRRRLVAETTRHGLGLVVDLVPNHMAASPTHNHWFRDVLEHGPSARHATHFDIDWDLPESSTQPKVLLTVLGDHYGREIESGVLRLHHDRGRFEVHYHDHHFPASPRSVAVVLSRAAERAESEELAFVGRALAALPPASVTDAALRAVRHADAAVLADLISSLTEQGAVRQAIDACVEEINGDPDELDRFLDMQNYRLARWQTAAHEIGYRRFFDIQTLIGLRVEEAEVFADSHRLVLEWVSDGEVDGLRVDHPDGLRRPGEYLHRLRAAAPQAWIVVEKILEGDETLPADWPVDGTTGYEFLNRVTTLFVDPAAEGSMTQLWNATTGDAATWTEVADNAKREILHNVLAADLNRLTAVFLEVCQRRRNYRDFTRSELSEALAETIVRLDVYRTYIHSGSAPRPEDTARLAAARDEAQEARADLDPELFTLLGQILGGKLDGGPEAELRLRFQQLSGPVMAKGVEDTAFYRYLRFAALCEVGGDPDRFGYSDVGDLHEYFRQTHATHPTTMLALSTHDTKRSEDVRARLAVLSEIPTEWAAAVRRWQKHNAAHGSLDGATEYLIYQTLVGAHPIGPDRLLPYLEKATKEAKVHTSWTAPDSTYDAAVAGFAAAVLDDAEFAADLAAFVASISPAGRVNALAQKAVQLTAPGVPDLYQGTELWDLSLVDPDNRRSVDHELRRKLVAEVAGLGAEQVMARADEGLPKLWLIAKILDLRARRGEAFSPQGDYRALAVSGPAASHAFAYSRGEAVAVLVPRFGLRREAGGGWHDTMLDLPPGSWQNVLTGSVSDGPVPVERLLTDFPVAVLERSPA